MASGSIRDTEVLVLVLLQERAPLSLKDLGRWVGELKVTFKAEREEGTLDESLHGLNGCVDDVPKAVRLLLDRGVVERVGANPKEWVYRLSSKFQSFNLIERAIDAIKTHMAKVRLR